VILHVKGIAIPNEITTCHALQV